MSYRRLAQKRTQAQGSYEFNDILWNSSLLYFCLTTFFNILNLAFWAGYHNSNATVLGPMGIVITSMMSARVSKYLTFLFFVPYKKLIINLRQFWMYMTTRTVVVVHSEPPIFNQRKSQLLLLHAQFHSVLPSLPPLFLYVSKSNYHFSRLLSNFALL